MDTQLINGRKIAAKLYGELAEQVAHLSEQERTITLAFVLVGQDDSTLSYVRSLRRSCQRVGVDFKRVDLAEDVAESDLHRRLDQLSCDDRIDGIILQRPLPERVDELKAARHIRIDKDIDCTNPENLGLLFLGKPCFLPCTPAAVIEVLARKGIEPKGQHVVIIGRSAVVGRPLAHFMTRNGVMGDATITLCHSHTHHLAEHTRRADLF